MNKRIIAKLDIKGPNLVKGIHLEGLRVMGDPAGFAEYYSKNGADELLYMDVVASLYERNSIHDLVSATARKTFIPITVGGGLRTIDDIRAVLRAGADKVSINTAATRDPGFIRSAAQIFGNSTIVVTIEAIKSPADGKYYAYVDNGREETGKEVVSWAQEAARLGAGEIVITSVDREGTGEGYDVALTRAVADAVDVPVVACGGAGSPDDIAAVLSTGRADAAAVASVIHYQRLDDLEGEHSAGHSEGNVEFIKSRRSFSKIHPVTIPAIKKHLVEASVQVRPTP